MLRTECYTELVEVLVEVSNGKCDTLSPVQIVIGSYWESGVIGIDFSAPEH